MCVCAFVFACGYVRVGMCVCLYLFVYTCVYMHVSVCSYMRVLIFFVYECEWCLRTSVGVCSPALLCVRVAFSLIQSLIEQSQKPMEDIRIRFLLLKF